MKRAHENEQYVPNYISNLCKIILISKMFESSVFLDLYIPVYFQQVFQHENSKIGIKKQDQLSVKSLFYFIKFAYSQYAANNLQQSFFQFLSRQFQSRSNREPEGHCFSSVKKSLRKGKVFEFIEQNMDKVSQTFIDLLIKISKIKFQTKTKTLKNQQIFQYQTQIIKILQIARLNYEFNRIKYGDLKDFDQYVLQIFNLVIDESNSPDFQSVIKLILKNQFNNLSDQSIYQILNNIESLKIAGHNQKHFQNQISSSKQIFNFLRKGLHKGHRKIKKPKNELLQQKNNNRDKKLQQGVLSSPYKNVQIRHRQSSSPISRIKSYAKVQKIKPINKKRTIYFERKNVHLPKCRQLYEKMSLFPTQTSILSQFQKKTEKKLFRFQNSQSTFEDLDNEAILVRSTPKPVKKFIAKMISHKLDF